MWRPLQSWWCDDRGSALLEGAIVTPFLVVLCFGVYEYSWYFYRQHLVSTGVRDAARYLSRTAFNPCSDATTVAKAKDLATTGLSSNPVKDRVPGWTAAQVTVSCVPVATSVCGITP